MMQSWRAEQKKQSTNALLLLTIFNHASWSTLHIASRYLQVYAKPITFDGQGVLSSAKGFAALFLFLVGVINSWIESVRSRVVVGSGGQTIGDGNYIESSALTSSLPSVNASLSASASYLCDSSHSSSSEFGDNDSTSNQCDTNGTPLQQKQSSIAGSSQREEEELGIDTSTSLRRKRAAYTLLFAFVSTSRASSNIASSKYTYPYNITLIASFTPVIIAIIDRFILHSPFPPLLWPTIIISGFGGTLIAISQSIDGDEEHVTSNQAKLSPTDNLIGCSLQLLSAIFSAFARILMKRTEHILTPTHIVQTNNISNCLFPFIYTIIHNPSSWTAFRYLVFTPKSLLAWCMMSIGVYSFASTVQIRLVRALGPGFYSSWVAVRVLGSLVLSTFILGEGINSWLEWVGIGLMIGTISVYIVETKKWMDCHRKEEEGKEVQYIHGEEEGGGGDEELVPVLDKENDPLLSGDGAKKYHE
ncbi:hypothetical protein ACHAXR_002889 [Thalassiosira sp. AJA248-18]